MATSASTVGLPEDKAYIAHHFNCPTCLPPGYPAASRHVAPKAKRCGTHTTGPLASATKPVAPFMHCIAPECWTALITSPVRLAANISPHRKQNHDCYSDPISLHYSVQGGRGEGLNHFHHHF
nr:hypothetical protein [Comamonas thiooxydans]